MSRSILCCISILVLVTAAASARAADDCETRIQKLDASKAEGAERLAEKNEVIGRCASQYKRDKTVERLVKECAKYEGQPVLKQQLVAECRLAAFNYANALQMLKAEHRK